MKSFTKMFFALLILPLILLSCLQTVSAQEVSTENDVKVRNFVFFPNTNFNYVETCRFTGNPIWLDVFLQINISMPDTQVLGVWSGGIPGEGTFLAMYQARDTYWLGETETLTYPLFAYEFDSAVLPENRTYTLRCALNEQPQPPQSTAQPVGAASGEFILDYWLIYAEDDTNPKSYEVSCTFWGDTTLRVEASVYNEAEHSLRSFTWYIDNNPPFAGFRSCSGATELVLNDPDESVVVVTLTTDNDFVVVYENDFYRYKEALPMLYSP